MKNRVFFLGFYLFYFALNFFCNPIYAEPISDEIVFYQKGFLPLSLSEHAQQIDRLFFLILGITGIFLIGTQVCLAWLIFRYRDSKHPTAKWMTGQKGKEWAWIFIISFLLLVVALSGQNVWKEIKTLKMDDSQTVRIKIQAEQYAWNIQYSGSDGEFETEDDVRTINQLSIPENTPVRITLTSIEKEGKPAVIHSFFLPELRLKQDVVPGTPVDVWFKALKTGRYEIACAEYCGFGHYSMRGIFEVQTREQFNSWLKQMSEEKGV